MVHGQLQVRGKTVDLPAFFPVMNIGKKQNDNTPVEEGQYPDINGALVNTISIRERKSVYREIKKPQKSIHDLLDFPEVVFADSGGFDLMNQDKDSPGVEEIYETQETMKADILATLDRPILPEMRQNKKNEIVQKNIETALRFNTVAKETDGLLYGTVHGHSPRIIRNSIKYLEEHGDFDGFALGGLVPLRSDYQKVIDLLLAARRATEKPLHVFGLGGFLYQLLLMYLGVDSYDSSGFIKCGSHRRYFVPGFGDHTMRNFEDLRRLPCTCPVCADRTVEEVKENRDLITQHNLWAMMMEKRRFKWVADTDQDLEEYLDWRFTGNTVTKRAFQTAKKKKKQLIR